VGSVIGTIFILLSIPVARCLLELLFSWSNRFSCFIIDTIIKLAISNLNVIGISIFLFVVFIFMVVFLSAILRDFPLSIKRTSEKKRQNIRLGYILIIEYFILTIFGIFLLNLHFTLESLNTSQKLRMGIIAPYIDDQKEKELWSKWYLIRSKIDYINFNDELDNIAENKNIKLPKSFY